MKTYIDFLCTLIYMLSFCQLTSGAWCSEEAAFDMVTGER